MPNLAETLDKRRADWHRLELLLEQVSAGRLVGNRAQSVAEVSALYRSACADLAMADQYRLSPETVNYLHDLIGRAHNTIYRSRRFQFQEWWHIAFHDAPRQIFADRCVHICTVLFFGLFALSAYFAYQEEAFPGFAETMLGAEQLSQMEATFSEVDFSPTGGRAIGTNIEMVAFYIQHNTGIGLECFALGPLVIPGLYTTAFNATMLGTSFGYMARGSSDGGDNFLEFVTAHGAFELTAIALAAAVGLRIGCGWLFTGGLSRMASLQVRGLEAVPVMAVSAALFFLAALTEGLLSPSAIPYMFKAAWAIFSSGLLMFYFVVLGYPTE